ncbi:MAG: hydantoinase/oxoprolinase family protein [Bacillota bacterium]
MLIGLDVGGTHVDAVLLQERKILKHVKVPTGEGSLLGPVGKALDSLLPEKDPNLVQQVNLSTTICTNAIVEKTVSPVGMFLISGPGLDPSFLNCGASTTFLSGSIDHRGRETAPLNPAEINAARNDLQAKGIRLAGIVGKFATRNPSQEKEVQRLLRPHFDQIVMGHTLSGRLGFPRRVYTTYLNLAVWEVYSSFVKAVSASLAQKGLRAPIHVLKADGGTMLLDASLKYPVETVLSGPAASIMGALALCPCNQDALVIDIGGTTTDIALLANGEPLLEPTGITIEGYPTLVRALGSHPAGIGGDSQIRVSKGEIRIGPRRLGPAMAFGGPAPTPTDAMIVLGLVDLGDRELAWAAMQIIAGELGCEPTKAAKLVHQAMVGAICQKAEEIIKETNTRPVYTVQEVLMERSIRPGIAIVIGGPAPAIAPALGKALGMQTIIPPNPGVANAVGAAASRTTTELTLLADTSQGKLSVPEEDLTETIPYNFSLAQARAKAIDLLRKRAARLGLTDNPPVDVLEEQSFNMVRGFTTTGKDLRVRVQVRPGVRVQFEEGGETLAES